MSVNRLDRVNQLIRREIGEALYKVMTEDGFDLSAVTITHVMTSSNLRSARVLVSIRDHKNERGSMLGLIRRHRKDIQSMINRDLTLKYTPRLNFELDTSLEQGDHILSVLAKMEDEMGPLDDPGEAIDTPPDLES